MSAYADSEIKTPWEYDLWFERQNLILEFNKEQIERIKAEPRDFIEDPIYAELIGEISHELDFDPFDMTDDQLQSAYDRFRRVVVMAPDALEHRINRKYAVEARNNIDGKFRENLKADLKPILTQEYSYRALGEANDDPFRVRKVHRVERGKEGSLKNRAHEVRGRLRGWLHRKTRPEREEPKERLPQG